MPKQPSIKSLRDKVDKLLSPLVIKMSPRCLLCKGHTQVAHHYVHKSKSNRLRYYVPNLINLCHGCHFKLHHNESVWANKIRDIKGEDWYNDIKDKIYETIKVDKYFYLQAIKDISEKMSVMQ